MSSTSLELKSTILKAGAGAGKTTELVNVLINYVADFKTQTGRYPKIVVTTFTRKATQELKERLLKKCLELGRQDLFNYVSNRSQLHISTIHGVLNLFLSKQGEQIGLSPDFKVVSEEENRSSARQILRKILIKDEQGVELLESYNFEAILSFCLDFYQAQQFSTDLHRATTETFEKIKHSYFSKTQEAAFSLAEHILAETNNDKWIYFAQQMQEVQWLNEGAIQNFFENNSKPVFSKKNPPVTDETNENLAAFMKQTKDSLEDESMTIQFWQQYEFFAQLFENMFVKFSQEFFKYKLEKSIITLSDFELLSYKIIQTSQEAAKNFAKLWDFWMVDEYQDTSPVQVQLLDCLIDDRPCFIVGDPQQSIYLFRGARSEVFFDKLKEFAVRKNHVNEKLINYRSEPHVLHFINTYFTKLDSQFSRMKVAPDKVSTQGPHTLQFLLHEEENAENTTQKNEDREAANVLGRVSELLELGVRAEQICILSRTRRRLEDVAHHLQLQAIPVQVHSSGGFYQRQEVNDCMSLLKFIVNPHDNKNLLSLLRAPWLDVTDQEILHIVHDRSHSYWAECILKKRQHPAYELLQQSLNEAIEIGIVRAFYNIILKSKIIDYSYVIDSSGRREANIWKFYDQLAQDSKMPGFNILEFLSESSSDIDLDDAANESDATPVIEPQRVNLMTIHASKGLQFEHVLLLGFDKKQNSRKESQFMFDEDSQTWTVPIPDVESQQLKKCLLAKKINQKLALREEAEFNRLLYVALTRAKSGITIFGSLSYENKSWASSCPLDLSLGSHPANDFEYLVRNESSYRFTKTQTATKKLTPRPLFAISEGAEKIKKFTASSILAAQKNTRATVATPSTHLQALKTVQKGVSAHRLFESLKYIDSQFDFKQEDAETKSAIQFIKTTKKAPLAEIIKNGEAEWGFVLKYDQFILQGQIDLWGFVENKMWVVDYKTGSQIYSEDAFAQLEIYAAALLHIHSNKKTDEVELVVVYPYDQEIKTRSIKNTSGFKEQIFAQIKQH